MLTFISSSWPSCYKMVLSTFLPREPSTSGTHSSLILTHVIWTERSAVLAVSVVSSSISYCQECVNWCLVYSQLAFKWFDMGMGDLEHETQTQLFQSRVLKVSLTNILTPNCLNTNLCSMTRWTQPSWTWRATSASGTSLRLSTLWRGS